MSDQIIISGHRFPTLVAITDEEHETGLMWRRWPPPIMIFPYKRAAIRKFWMKNTVSPLDILFCRGNKIVDICYGEPFSTRMIGPDAPVDLVVEVPHGTVRDYGIRIGDTVNPVLSNKTISRDVQNIFRNILK
jgi:uncharacterized membrane protein (UPF0127 family)